MTNEASKRSCLLIGGGGYIGSFLVPMLLATGRRVTVLGRRPLPSYPLPAGSDYVQGCFSDSRLLGNLLDKHHEVIHLAYATVPNTSFDNPLGDLLQNLPPTVQIFPRSQQERGASFWFHPAAQSTAKRLHCPFQRTILPGQFLLMELQNLRWKSMPISMRPRMACK